MFDLCPPDYRGYEVLRRQPLVLAHLASVTVASAAEAADRALRTARHALRDAVPPEVVDAAVAAYERERHRLAATARAVELVGRALRGERWAARL